jgi:phosphoribosylformylglycinamidine synthase
MLKIPGSSALSKFRIQKLLADLQAIEPAINHVSASFVHFAELENELSAADNEILLQLLAYGSDADNSNQLQGQSYYVVPRPGTISPWSSKATEIAQRCGLAIVRLERGIEYTLASTAEPDKHSQQPLQDLLHDRMTQTVVVFSISVLLPQDYHF